MTEEYWPMLDDNGGKPDIIIIISIIATILILGISLSGCSRVQYIPVETSSHVIDSVNIIDSVAVRWVHQITDSVRIRDSVVIVQDESGKVVREEYYRETERYRNLEKDYDELQMKYESLKAERIDTIRVPYPVEKKLSAWQKTRLYSYPILCMVIVVLSFIIVWITKNKAVR